MLEADVKLDWISKTEMMYLQGIGSGIIKRYFTRENVMVESPVEMVRRFARRERRTMISIWHIFESGGEPLFSEGFLKFVPSRFVLREELCGPSVTYMSPYFASYGGLMEAEQAMPKGARRMPGVPGATDDPRLRASFMIEGAKLS